MQQFTVPQFIDVESKVIGPITTRQFLIFLATAILIAIFYKIFDLSLFVTVSIFVSVIAIAFSFVKINGRPFHFFVLNLIQTWRRPHLRVWRNSPIAISEDTIPKVKKDLEKPIIKKYYKKSHLAELALIVDTQGRYKGE